MQQQSAVGSFFEYLAGFLLFITISFGLTFVVNRYTTERDAQQAAAAALALMLHER